MDKTWRSVILDFDYLSVQFDPKIFQQMRMTDQLLEYLLSSEVRIFMLRLCHESGKKEGSKIN